MIIFKYLIVVIKFWSFDFFYKEKEELESRVRELQSSWNNATSETDDMKKQLERQEVQILQLDKLFQENKQLQQKCATLKTAQEGNIILYFHRFT